MRLADPTLASSSLAEAQAIALTDEERRDLGADFDHAIEIIAGLG